MISIVARLANKALLWFVGARFDLCIRINLAIN